MPRFLNLFTNMPWPAKSALFFLVWLAMLAATGATGGLGGPLMVPLAVLHAAALLHRSRSTRPAIERTVFTGIVLTLAILALTVLWWLDLASKLPAAPAMDWLETLVVLFTLLFVGGWSWVINQGSGEDADTQSPPQGQGDWRRELEIEVRERTLRQQQAIEELRREVDERRLAESMLNRALNAAEAGVRAKSDFLANMSHEIRTPLNGVLGMAEVLLEGELDASERVSVVGAMQASGTLLLQIIDDILDLAKLDEGKVELEERPLSLRQCIEDVLESFARDAWKKGLSLSYRLHDSSEWVAADVTRLRQVLVNLVANAIKFTNEGEVSISVRQESPGVLRFSVTDTGIGIPSEFLDDLFEPFSQLDASTRRQFGGTGLGLAICSRLCELFGGRIWVESQDGVGSTFHFLLPAAEHGPGSTSGTGMGAALVAGLVGRVAAVIEPLPACGQAAEEMLVSMGMVVRLSDELPEDLEGLEVVLISAEHPQLDEYLAKVAAIKDLPALLMASIADSQSRERAVRLGLGGIVARPLRRAQVASALGDVLAVPLPRRRLAAEAGHEEMLASEAPMDILVAEDNEVNQLVVREILGLLGYEADVVDNGREAVEAFAKRSYDLVFMDIMMPVMDGLEATRRLRADFDDDEEHRPIIVALSASVMEEQRQSCLEAGVDRFLAKPMQLEATRQLLRSCYQERQSP